MRCDTRKLGSRLALALLCAAPALCQDLPAGLPEIRYHLTARPWMPLNVSRTSYLDAVEGIYRYTATIQDARGAVIDPFLKREFQYATPYFAFAVGTLAQAGKGAKSIWMPTASPTSCSASRADSCSSWRAGA